MVVVFSDCVVIALWRPQLGHRLFLFSMCFEPEAGGSRRNKQNRHQC